MATHTQPRWYRKWRIWITDKSKGINELLAAIGEPTMRFATIYLALATGIPYIKYIPAYTACQGIVISVPEFVILGALGVAEGACKEPHNKKWGRLLYAICALLAIIMAATFIDIFVYQFPQIAINFLNFSRCIVAVGFSITLGKLDQDEQGQAPAQPQPSPVPAAPPAPPVDLTPLTEQIAKLADQVAQMQAEKQDSEQAKTGQDDGTESGQFAGNDQAEEQDENGTDDGTAGATNITVLRPRGRDKMQDSGRDKSRTGSTSTKASRAAALIKRNPHISAPELAKKLDVDISYARRLLAKKSEAPGA